MVIKKDKSTEERIFEAATEVFLEKGMEAATVQDIADRAGINKSLLNYYYRSKDRLFDAVFEMVSLKMMEKFSPLLDEQLSIEEKLNFFFNEHISFLQKNPRLPLFLMIEMNRDPHRLEKFLSSLNVERLLTVINTRDPGKIRKNKMNRESVIQLLTIIVSISVFPFAAKGAIEAILKKIGMNFNDYIEVRKKFAAEFVLSAISGMTPGQSPGPAFRSKGRWIEPKRSKKMKIK
jgi:TetR/AcrR family transcriptional regulator